jgi:hypothetical protein
MVSQTLVDIVIIDLIRANFVLQVALSHGVATIVTSWAKDDFYCNQYLMNMFLFLVIKVFGCLHQQINNFFH